MKPEHLRISEAITKLKSDPDPVDEFIDSLTTVLESHGIDTSNWDGDEPPAKIIGDHVGHLVKEAPQPFTQTTLAL